MAAALTTAIAFVKTWGAIALTIASLAYQVNQANKQREAQARAKAAAEAAAEARRGFETVIDGDVASIPLVYGRAKIGGVRAWVASTSSMKFSGTHNANSLIGTVPTTNQTGTKNEYLAFQQALCLGPINAIYDVSINETFSYDETGFLALHIECHTNGGINNNVKNNFVERKDAAFTGFAYVNAFIKADRENPEDVPNMAFYIEGRKIRTITKVGSVYSINNTRVYSNNPALCLLDYLLEDNSDSVLNIATKALSLSEIDLESFYNVSLICDKIVQSNVIVGGRIWQPKTNIRTVTTRDLPLYECNLVLDTRKTLRDNIEIILSTMGDARLIWSEGKYRLSLQYPGAA